MSLEIVNLTKTFGQQDAVHMLSFQARKGEILGFLGPNGAGKSTTMKIATAYMPPTHGTVRVCGMDVTEEETAVRRKIGYLPEHNPLYNDMYVHEFLHFSGHMNGLSGKRLKEGIQQIIRTTGLEREQHKHIGALSKGYRQRVGLAAALLHDPEVLILDEPTSGLDANQVMDMRSLIKHLGKDKTVVFSSHIMAEVEAVCDRVVIINNGKKVADGHFNELKSGQGLQRIETEFEESIDPKLLDQIPGVERIEAIGETGFNLYSKDAKAIRKDIFKVAAQKDLPLVELHLHRNNLEELFRALTHTQEA